MSAAQQAEAAHFRAHVHYLAQSDGEKDGFDRELDVLLALDHRAQMTPNVFFSASLSSSLTKNRFVGVLPNEHTLVRLHSSGKSGNTYINANYIDCRKTTFGVPYVYIATQAPLLNTTLDFWRMIIQEKVSFIVMLCGTKENNKCKSEVYWPQSDNSTIRVGASIVQMVSQEVYEDLVRRIFRVIETKPGAVVGGNESDMGADDDAGQRLDFFTLDRDGSSHRFIAASTRYVCHVQYLGWPDMGLPPSSRSLMMILHELNAHLRADSAASETGCASHDDTDAALGASDFAPNQPATTAPIVVHCSGGVGRTGVFIAMHMALTQFDRLSRHLLDEDNPPQEQQPHDTKHTVRHIDIPAMVAFLKLCRTGMVSTREQYLFLYYAILREMNRITQWRRPPSSMRVHAAQTVLRAPPLSGRSPPRRRAADSAAPVPSHARHAHHSYPPSPSPVAAAAAARMSGTLDSDSSVGIVSRHRHRMQGAVHTMSPTTEPETQSRVTCEPFLAARRKKSIVHALIHRLFHRNRTMVADHFGVAEMLPAQSYDAMQRDMAVMHRYLATHHRTRLALHSTEKSSSFAPPPQQQQKRQVCDGASRQAHDHVATMRRAAAVRSSATQTCPRDASEHEDKSAETTGRSRTDTTRRVRQSQRIHSASRPSSASCRHDRFTRPTNTQSGVHRAASLASTNISTALLSNPCASHMTHPVLADAAAHSRAHATTMSHSTHVESSPRVASRDALSASERRVGVEAAADTSSPQRRPLCCVSAPRVSPPCEGRESSELPNCRRGYGKLTAEEMDLL